MDLHATIGNRIRLEREKKQMDQKELATKVNKTAPMISGIERGTKKINLELLFSIANALDVPVYKLLGERKEEYEKYVNEEKIADLELIKQTIITKGHVDGVEIPDHLKEIIGSVMQTVIDQTKHELIQKKDQSKDK